MNIRQFPTRIKWYNCGPTTYDHSHIGHARNYVCIDIIRRILLHYNHHIIMLQNVTDIDDKIINRGRHIFLVNLFWAKPNKESMHLALDKYIKDYFNCTNQEYPVKSNEMLKIATDIEEKAKIEMRIVAVKKFQEHMNGTSNSANDEVYENTFDVLAYYLDSVATETDLKSYSDDHKQFTDMSRYWENEYNKDMETLNVMPPNIITRATEYIGPIIEHINLIKKNGYAYEKNNSVYFDVVKFNKEHGYSKLEPQHVTDTFGKEDTTGEKKHLEDFALWKASKSGEPSWESPFGIGRPGWHIECSAMACHFFKTLDIHSGGIDLLFPHHTNECAQAEAAYLQKWCEKFIHIGHLHIKGAKMSKSLKNFITIKDMLKKYTPQQFRLLCLMQPWQGTLDYQEETMKEVSSAESTIKNFLLNVKAKLLERNTCMPPFSQLELDFLEKMRMLQESTDNNLQELNTHHVIQDVLRIINEANSHSLDARILQLIAEYITQIFKILGLINSNLKVDYSYQESSVLLFNVE
eukprot:NODE_503_length_6696_cov_1.475216.p2 type:complete len:522 gc:universal NODE_503_length_6696_cov_1.475216:4355-5920(+)